MNKLRQLPISTQIYLMFGLICLFLAADGGLIFLSMRAIEAHNLERMNIGRGWKVSNDVARDLGRMQAEVLRHVLITEAEGMRLHDQIIKELRELNAKKLVRYRDFADNRQKIGAQDRAGLAERLYLKHTDSLLALSRANADIDKVRYAISIQSPAYDTFQSAVAAMSDVAEREATLSVVKTSQEFSSAKIRATSMFGLSLLAIAATALGILQITRMLKEDNRLLRARMAEREQAEDARRLIESRYQTLFEHAPDGILIANPESYYLDANPSICRMLGYTREELTGMHARDIVCPTEVQHIGKALGTIHKEGIYQREWRFRHKDGSTFETEVIVALMPDRNLLATIRDITERKRADEHIRVMNAELENRVALRTGELQTANRELEAFSYTVSHDLRGPVRAINGFTEIVVEEYGSSLPDEARHYLGRIREGGRQMGLLIDDLLAFSRLGRQSLRKSQVDMSRLVRVVWDESKSCQEGRLIDMSIGEMPDCEGDAALLKQVWVNLLSNAIKYTRGCDLATIQVGCNSESGQGVYFVRDDGAGFDMKYANKLFGVFQRLHGPDEFEGTGVGLAIVQRIVQRHGGRVWAEGCVDKGATFYFSL